MTVVPKAVAFSSRYMLVHMFLLPAQHLRALRGALRPVNLNTTTVKFPMEVIHKAKFTGTTLA